MSGLRFKFYDNNHSHLVSNMVFISVAKKVVKWNKFFVRETNMIFAIIIAVIGFSLLLLYGAAVFYMKWLASQINKMGGGIENNLNEVFKDK